MIWCARIVESVIKRDNKMILAKHRWDKTLVAFGESDETEEILTQICGIQSCQNLGHGGRISGTY